MHRGKKSKSWSQTMVYTLFRCIWLHDVGNQGSHHHVSTYMMYVVNGDSLHTSCMWIHDDMILDFIHDDFSYTIDEFFYTSCNQIHRNRVYIIDGLSLPCYAGGIPEISEYCFQKIKFSKLLAFNVNVDEIELFKGFLFLVLFTKRVTNWVLTLLSTRNNSMRSLD